MMSIDIKIIFLYFRKELTIREICDVLDLKHEYVQSVISYEILGVNQAHSQELIEDPDMVLINVPIHHKYESEMVIDKDTGAKYKSVSHAAKVHQMRPSSLWRMLYGVRKNNTSLILYHE